MTDKKNIKKRSQRSFEQSLEQLEDIVEQLESGQLSLENGLKKFEQGVIFYKECKDFLGKAEKKITVLTESLKEEEL